MGNWFTNAIRTILLIPSDEEYKVPQEALDILERTGAKPVVLHIPPNTTIVTRSILSAPSPDLLCYRPGNGTLGVNQFAQKIEEGYRLFRLEDKSSARDCWIRIEEEAIFLAYPSYEKRNRHIYKFAVLPLKEFKHKSRRVSGNTIANVIGHMMSGSHIGDDCYIPYEEISQQEVPLRMGWNGECPKENK